MACCSIVRMHEARRNVGMSSFEQRAGRIASVVQVLMVLLWVQKLVVERRCGHL